MEYALDDPIGCFDVVFDKKLYDPPQSVIEFEKAMLMELEQKK